MHKPIKYVEKAVTIGAKGAWLVFDRMNRIKPNPSPTPKWSDKPLLKSYQKSKPPLGWPRATDSLCPKCVPEIRQQILDGHLPYEVLMNEKVGEIKATIIEQDGKIMMVKECPKHGRFEDVMSIDTEFSKHLEDVFPGRDIRAHNDEKLHKHGSSTVKYGRGSVLTIDLTNRCNMMCDPCFMDANQVGFVHELTWEEIKTMLDNAITIKPRRQMSVQFSGGEPTLSPYFLDAVRYARHVGYNSVQAATNGIEFAKSFEFAQQAAEAGMRYAYLQFDGIGNAANAHRKVGNLFDVKLKAIDNLHRAGVEIVPVVTIVNGINNEQVGRIIQFALDNPKKIGFLSFQPVSFTGRDEAITDDRRKAQRYTLSHLAHDVKNQTGLGEPKRDWFPISFMSTFSDWADLMHVEDKNNDWGQLSCGCHPNCGTGMAVMIDKETKEAVPVTAFLHGDQLAKDIAKVNDASRGKFLTIVGMALCLMKNYDPFHSPTHFKLMDLLKKFDKNFNATGKDYGKVGPDRSIEDVMKRRQDRWNFLFIAGMWFQDLFNYDFRRTEMCIIPYATQQGEISFCAYNTGIGWRKIIENMYKNATVAQWYKTHGKHQIYAKGRAVDLNTYEHSLVIDKDDAAKVREHESDIPMTAAAEDKMRRRMALEEAAKVRAIYEEMVLKKPQQ
ncbi:MAG TPA: radical SAM protein, partial [Terriglobales bacterium]|nr:radical SAM protein [Terriglobales bacterium]